MVFAITFVRLAEYGCRCPRATRENGCTEDSDCDRTADNEIESDNRNSQTAAGNSSRVRLRSKFLEKSAKPSDDVKSAVDNSSKRLR